jgi:hypothetical protein
LREVEIVEGVEDDRIIEEVELVSRQPEVGKKDGEVKIV